MLCTWYNCGMKKKRSDNLIIPDNRGKTYRRHKTDDLRPQLFKLHYTDPKSDTFLNIRQSAMRAGYKQEYADNLSCKINRPKWFQELMECGEVRRARMLGKAEQGIEEALDYKSEDNSKAALKLKASSFVAERLGKDFYSTRQEITDAGGRRLFSKEDSNAANVPLEQLFTTVKLSPDDNK